MPYKPSVAQIELSPIQAIVVTLYETKHDHENKIFIISSTDAQGNILLLYSNYQLYSFNFICCFLLLYSDSRMTTSLTRNMNNN